jgi:hypothetical protein
MSSDEKRAARAARFSMLRRPGETGRIKLVSLLAQPRARGKKNRSDARNVNNPEENPVTLPPATNYGLSMLPPLSAQSLKPPRL